MSKIDKHIVLLGAPGSGKGSQSEMFVEKLAYQHVATGDLLRAEVSSGSKLGVDIKDKISNGQLVEDYLIFELLKKSIDLDSGHYVFDGFPRTLKQASLLDELLVDRDYKVIYLDVDQELIVERVTNRRISPCGKHIYNLITRPPKVEGLCDITGKALIHRDDDNEAVVRERLKIFSRQIEPILSYYEKEGLLIRVTPDVGVKNTFNKIIDKYFS